MTVKEYLPKGSALPSIIAQATKDMNSLQLGKFREELAKSLPVLIKQAADAAKNPKEQKP